MISREVAKQGSGVAKPRNHPLCRATRFRNLSLYPTRYPLTRLPAYLLPGLSNSQKLMRLQAEPPARMLETILQRLRGVGLALRSVHRLEKVMPKLEMLVPGRLASHLGKHQLELVPTPHHQLGASLGAHTEPVDATGRLDRSIGFDCDFEPSPVEGLDQLAVELQQRLATGTHHEPAALGPRRPGSGHCFCQLVGRAETPATRPIE